MDIWLAAVLLTWLPVAAVLAVLIGRSVLHTSLRERLVAALTPSGRAAMTPSAAVAEPVGTGAPERVGA